MVQAAEIIGQLERQHGNDPIRQIYGSAPPIRFIIQKGAFGYIAGHIGYVNAQGEMTIFLLFAVDRIVQILGIRAIDGDNRHISIICHPFFRYNGARQIVRLLHEVIGKYMGQTMLGNNNVNIKALIAFVTDDFRHLAFRIGPLAGPAGHLHHDAGTGNRSHFIAFGNLDDHVHLFINRYRFPAIRQHFISTYKHIICPFNDTGNPALRIMAASFAFHGLHFYRIIIYSVQMILLCNVHILMVIIGEQEAKTAIRFIHALQNDAGLIRQQFLFFH